METKTTYVLLLSCVMAAGVAAYDAHAQTNSERLESIDDTTSALEGTVAAIQAAIASLGAQISNVLDGIADLQMSVDGIDDKVAGVETSISSMSDTVDSSASSINSLADTVSGLETRISGLEGALMNGGTGGATDLSSIEEALAGMLIANSQVRNDIAELNNRLVTIQAELGTVSEEVKQPDAGPAVFVESTTDRLVTAIDYLRSGDDTTVNQETYYDLVMTFTCDNDVYLKTAKITPAFKYNDATAANNQEYLSRADNRAETGATTILQNTITTEGRTLYDNKFNPSGGNAPTSTFVYINPGESFNNRLLKTTDKLEIKSRVYDGNFTRTAGANLVNTETDRGNLYDSAITLPDPHAGATHMFIKDATRDTTKGQNVDLYTLAVDWVATQSTTNCSISFGSTGTTPGLTKSGTFNYGVNLDDASTTLRTFMDYFSCGGEPLEITEVTTGTGTPWNESLNKFASLEMTVSGKDTPSITYKLNMDGTLGEDDGQLPSSSGDSIKIDGRVPSAQGLIVELKYKTVSGATCGVSQTP